MRLKGRDARDVDVPAAPTPIDVFDRGPSQSVHAIDQALARYGSRHLVRSEEVIDLLLDLRATILTEATFTHLLADLERW